MSTQPILFIPDEPSKPQNVEVVDWDKDHADLKWKKPENDGGAPITGYIIEFKVKLIFLVIHPV
jgi:Fibronectin type III domain.